MSNTLVVQNNNTGVDVKRISSREVAEMMELRHTDLIRKIDKITKTLENAKMRFQKYWIESTYKVEGNNKTYKEYLVSKEGCEFLAHKSTGEKGILFTHRYMERFKEMEQIIEQGPQQVVSTDQIAQMINEAVTKQVMVMMNPIIDRLDKIVQGVNAPRSEQLTFDTLDLPYTATNIGKKINRTASVTNKILLQRGILSIKDGSWTLNKQYEDKGWGKTVKGQYRGKTYVRYTEKGMQEIIKILSRSSNQEQIKLF